MVYHSQHTPRFEHGRKSLERLIEMTVGEPVVDVAECDDGIG